MFDPEIIADFRDQLARSMAARAEIPSFDPLPADVWVTMAALQKSIRRGRHDIALRAAARLLIDAPDRFWRRVGGIAFEDVGLADFDTVGLTVAALAGKRVRGALGGSWAVASFLVTELASASKCRATDDLLLTVERHPALANARRDYAALSTKELLKISAEGDDLPSRALALRYAIGVYRSSREMRQRRGEPAAAFDALFDAGLPPTLVGVARAGYRRTGEPLAAFLPLLWPARHAEKAVVADDQTPLETVLNGVLPSWCVDRYSRAGTACLREFLRHDTSTGRWITANVPVARRVDFLGDLVFRAEGQLCQRRMIWPTATELRRRVDLECFPGCADATEILDLMRQDLPEMNQVRVALNGGLRHAG